MNNLDDLKAIWHTAKTDELPSSKEMLKLVKGFRNQKLRSKWLVIIITLVLTGIIAAVLIDRNFKLITTYIGGGLSILAGLLLVATNLKSLKRFYQLDDCSNREFLAFIEQTRKNQIYYYQKTMVVILILYSVGWVLYLYEQTYQHLFWFIGVYAAVAVYLAIMWFVVRPRSFKKDADKLNAMSKRLENISNQLK